VNGNNINNKTEAQFNSKGVWTVLWILAMLCIIGALRFMSLLKVNVCISFCGLALLLSTIGVCVGMRASRAKLEVDDNYVFFKTLFGRKKYLPIESVTAVGTGFFNTVCITSPSCVIRCMLVKNKDDIIEAVKEKIEKRA